MTTPPSLQPRQSMSFRDSRAPHEIQADFEQLWTTVLTPELDQDQLNYKGSSHALGAPCQFLIQYEGRTFWKHTYTLHVTTNLTRVAPENLEYYRKDSVNWFKFWTSKLDQCEPALSNQVHTLPYSKTVQEALSFEAILDSPPTIQHLILSALKDGMIFSTSHKEGGTIIRSREDKFISSDFGESTDYKIFSDPQAFLDYIHRYFEWKIKNAYSPAAPTEYQIWRLIYRMLRKP